MCHDLASRLLPNTKTPFLLKSVPIFAISGRRVHVDIRVAINDIHQLSFLSRFGR